MKLVKYIDYQLQSEVFLEKLISTTQAALQQPAHGRGVFADSWVQHKVILLDGEGEVICQISECFIMVSDDGAMEAISINPFLDYECTYKGIIMVLCIPKQLAVDKRGGAARQLEMDDTVCS